MASRRIAFTEGVACGESADRRAAHTHHDSTGSSGPRLVARGTHNHESRVPIRSLESRPVTVKRRKSQPHGLPVDGVAGPPRTANSPLGECARPRDRPAGRRTRSGLWRPRSNGRQRPPSARFPRSPRAGWWPPSNPSSCWPATAACGARLSRPESVSPARRRVQQTETHPGRHAVSRRRCHIGTSRDPQRAGRGPAE